MRKLLFAAFFTLIASSLFAQTERQSDLRFAFTASPQVSWLSSDHADIEGDGSSFGYNFGVVLDKFFAPNYAFTTGLTINTTGGNLQYNEGGEFSIGGKPTELEPGESLEYRLKYLEIPMSLKLQTNDQQRTSFYGIFGLSANINVKTNDGNGNSLSNEVRNLFGSYHFGGGLQHSLGGSTYLSAGIHYNQGFNDITKNESFDDKTVLNRLVFQLAIIF